MTDPSLKELFHPCQLEKKFGGTAESPKNFWPPYVGKDFIPAENTDKFKIMTDEEYITALTQNKGLPVHP